MIELSHVTKVYGGTHTAVNNCSFQVEDGKITGFIGPNGAGKTTTLKMITGILEPTEGQILLDGTDIQRNPLEAKKKIGFVSDNPDNFLRLKGLEYLNFMADNYQVSAAQRKNHIEKYLSLFDLEGAVNSQIRSYSKGMKQKLVVIGALIHQPPVWILDEPLSGLDPRAAHLLKEEMQRHCQAGNTVFFSTHVLEVAERLCTRIGVISHGQLRAEGTLEQLRSGEVGASLEQLFLELTDDGGDAQ